MWKAKSVAFLILCGIFVFCQEDSNSQGPVLPADPPLAQAPPVPNGVDVQARGPVHEAFAAPSNEAAPAPAINRKPPVPLDEMPPEERPEGDMVWIGGYYHFDDDRQDFIWVSGCWRARPQGREWVPGYWREENGNYQWIAGFWAVATQDNKVSAVSYQPQPPAPPAVAPPGDPPAADAIYIPGGWVWLESRYVWRAGFWTHGQPGFIYIPGHYRWTPRGYIYIAGHWDYALQRRGLVYAPVIVAPGVAGVGFVYTPGYAINDGFILDAMFIRPAYCHYYFGDYYGPRYAGWGFEPCVYYSRRGFYDPIVVYQRYQNPAWFNVQINLVGDRFAGRVALPPRRLAQIDRRDSRFIAPGRVVVGLHGGRAVAVAHADRLRAKEHFANLQKTVNEQRRATEMHKAAAGGGVHTAPINHNGSMVHQNTTPPNVRPQVKQPPQPGQHPATKQPVKKEPHKV